MLLLSFLCHLSFAHSFLFFMGGNQMRNLPHLPLISFSPIVVSIVAVLQNRYLHDEDYLESLDEDEDPPACKGRVYGQRPANVYLLTTTGAALCVAVRIIEPALKGDGTWWQ
jgi:hypothetical protein